MRVSEVGGDRAWDVALPAGTPQYVARAWAIAIPYLLLTEYGAEQEDLLGVVCSDDKALSAVANSAEGVVRGYAGNIIAFSQRLLRIKRGSYPVVRERTEEEKELEPPTIEGGGLHDRFTWTEANGVGSGPPRVCDIFLSLIHI